MKVTVIIKNVTDVFFDGNGGSIVGLNNKSDKEKFAYLNKMAVDMRDCIKMKIGNDSFRDRVELNQIMRGNACYTYKIEPRRGYKLVTFEVVSA